METMLKIYDTEAREADAKNAFHMSLVKKAASELGIYELKELSTHTQKPDCIIYELVYLTNAEITFSSGQELMLLHGMQLRLSYSESLNEVITEVRHGFRRHFRNDNDLTIKGIKLREWILVGLGCTLIEKWGGILAYFAEREYPDIQSHIRKQKVDSLFS